MIRIVESFKEFIDTASISQGPNAWTIYGANPTSDNFIEWLEEKLKSLEEAGEITNKGKSDILLNTQKIFNSRHHLNRLHHKKA